MTPNDDILSNDHPGGGKPVKVNLGATGKPPADDKLMAYLEGNLSAAEQHEVELWLTEEGMESDAIEGLKTIKTDDAKRSVSRLNNDLGRTIKGKRRTRKKAGPDSNLLVSVVVILLLCVVAFLVFKYVVHK